MFDHPGSVPVRDAGGGNSRSADGGRRGRNCRCRHSGRRRGNQAGRSDGSARRQGNGALRALQSRKKRRPRNVLGKRSGAGSAGKTESFACHDLRNRRTDPRGAGLRSGGADDRHRRKRHGGRRRGNGSGARISSAGRGRRRTGVRRGISGKSCTNRRFRSGSAALFHKNQSRMRCHEPPAGSGRRRNGIWSPERRDAGNGDCTGTGTRGSGECLA